MPMTNLLDLIKPVPVIEVDESKLPLEERFALYNARNPQVYQELRRLALEWVDAGHDSCSIDLLFNVLRWQSGLRTKDDEGFKLNNSYRSRFSRLLMENEPRLAGKFETRELHTVG